ncbi:MAG: hypothetical protein AABY22_16675, partial [Nanoarchaeota archaeon]
MNKIKDITGQKFGRLTVLEQTGFDKNQHAKWKCLCECGQYKEILSSSLIQKCTKSCGCLIGPPDSFKNLAGKKFGKWAVIKRVENYIIGKQQHKQYL